MNRRSVMAALVAGGPTLAGCTSRGTPGRDTTTSSPEHGDRDVSISSVDDAPADAPLDPAVEVVRSSVSTDRTARLRVTVTNSADRPVWNKYVQIPAFSSFITEEGPQGQELLLLQPDEQYDTVGFGCWRADLDEWQLNHAYTDVVTDVRYDAGESRTTAFDVYGHPENTGPCVAPGDYRIENKYAIAADDDAEQADWDFYWGFSITVGER